MSFTFVRYFRNISTLLLCLCILNGCQFGKYAKNSKNVVVLQEQLYTQGVDLIKDKKYSKAAKHFFEMYTEEPSSKFAAKAMLLEAYCLYKNKNYLDAIYTLDDLAKFHPQGFNKEYACYLKMLSYKNQINKIEGCSAVALEALNWGMAITMLFPKSIYAQDVAANHIPFIKDYLLEKEMLVGRYHLNRGNSVGALLSFQNVVKDSRDHYFLPEALFRIVESYMAMGLKDEALECKNKLISQFPGSIWAQHASKF